jgi:hypothetical protein
MAWRNRWLLAWFGPRGLSSLLLVLLPVFAGMPGAEQLLTVCCLVVLVSVVVHGLSPMVLLRESPESAPVPAFFERADTVPGSAKSGFVSGNSQEATVKRLGLTDPEYINVAELRALQEAGRPLVVVDARTDRTFNESDLLAEGALRLNPERPVLEAEKHQLPRDAVLAVFCA